MKNSILQQGKLYEFERALIYNKHKQKINQITKKRSSHSVINTQSTLPIFPSSFKTEQQLKIQQQNNRLVLRLFQINRRKKPQILTSVEQHRHAIKLSLLNKKHHQLSRLNKEKQIQQQNQKLVYKLLSHKQNQKYKNEYTRDQNDPFLIRKSRSKSKLSPEKKNKSYSIKSQLKIIDKPSPKNNHKPKLHSERQRNFSTVLPTLSPKAINHNQILNMLKKYSPYKDNQKENNNVNYEYQQEDFQPMIDYQQTDQETVDKYLRKDPSQQQHEQEPKKGTIPQQILLGNDDQRKQVDQFRHNKQTNDQIRSSKGRDKRPPNRRTVISKLTEQNQYQAEQFQSHTD